MDSIRRIKQPEVAAHPLVILPLPQNPPRQPSTKTYISRHKGATIAMLGYNALAMMTLLALLQGDGQFYGATPFQWVSTLGIAGSALAAFSLWYFRIKEPRDARDNKEEIARVIAASKAEAERLIASQEAQQKTYERFLEKQEERHKAENETRALYHKADLDRAHATFTATMESTLSRLDINNKKIADLGDAVHCLEQAVRNRGAY